MRETLSPVSWERCVDGSVLRRSGWLGSELPWGCCSIPVLPGLPGETQPPQCSGTHCCPLLVPGHKELWMQEASEAVVEPGNLLCFQGMVLCGNRLLRWRSLYS